MLRLLERPRRNRLKEATRTLIQESHLRREDIVTPLFLLPGLKREEEIPSLPYVKRRSSDLLLKEAERLLSLGVQAVDLFPIVEPRLKDPYGRVALSKENPLYEALRLLKKELPELLLMVDIALDPYTDHGHDGLLRQDGIVDNDSTLEALASLSLKAAESGADVVAPSDMMDGRVRYLREALDHASFQEVSILAYSAKYASSLYGPFREALKTSLSSGNKKNYQMNPANVREALREARLDEEEGADMLLIKPALSYLDVIAKVKEKTTLPVAAYHVSGEYAMVMAAGEKGWLDSNRVLKEHLLSIKRAGADFILTYVDPALI